MNRLLRDIIQKIDLKFNLGMSFNTLPEEIFSSFISMQIIKNEKSQITLNANSWPPDRNLLVNNNSDIEPVNYKTIQYGHIEKRFVKLTGLSKPYAGKSGIYQMSIAPDQNKLHTIRVSFASAGESITISYEK